MYFGFGVKSRGGMYKCTNSMYGHHSMADESLPDIMMLANIGEPQQEEDFVLAAYDPT